MRPFENEEYFSTPGLVKTYFASPERVSFDDARIESDSITNDPIVQVILKAVSGHLLILNRHRQVIAANEEVLSSLRLRTMDSVIGKRPGEAFFCEHSDEGPGGCGTSRHCRACGAVIAMLAALENLQPSDNRCYMTIKTSKGYESREFKIRCSPLNIGGTEFLAFVMNDISSAVRREVLEKIFLHDITNSLASLYTWAHMMPPGDPGGVAAKIVQIAENLKHDIETHRIITQAEAESLKLSKSKTSASHIFELLKNHYIHRDLVSRKNLQLHSVEDDTLFYTDISLLMRVLTNMINNGFEATIPGNTVSVYCRHSDNMIGFYVHNEEVIPQTVALQIFKRSFSTKAEKGRGLGTYSMKILGENYLNGNVSFSSSPYEGTIFSIMLPVEKDN
ncbi:MAG: HAMP domain-containing histidine kinase [Nitrospiraceae bacterium]|nr:HAMP domain-containing histidine kinase [Nitrospiraceae bacterium]